MALVTMLICGSICAQEQHYTFNYHEFQHQMTAIVQVNIDGVEQTSSDIELGAFNGETVTGSERIGVYGSAGYHRVYLAVYFNQVYDVSFKIYNHQTGVELDNYNVTFEGEPFTMACVPDAAYGLRKNPVVINFTTPQTFEKPITAYTSDKDRYYLIASPIGTVSPENVTNMLENSYDLYYFNQSASDGLEWINYEAGAFDLTPGKGYLYANSNDVTLTFTGTPYNGSGEVALTKTDNVDWSGWNLVGNPFGTDAALNMPFIRLSEGAYNEVNTENQTVNVMEGVFVQATENGQNANFTPVRRGESTNIAKLNISVVASTSSSTALDNAIVRFDGGATLGKFQLNPNHTKVYIPQDGKDYAIVRSATQGELPLNFKAEKNGTYTLSFNSEEVTFSYLHLIDNMTGADVDLLRQPNYTFDARTTDYASRFRLVFNSSDANEAVCEPSFAYFNGSNWTVSATGSGAATLQVIDMMGRVLSSETISGNTEININQPAGVYMLRLIDNENVRVQKVVVR